MKLIRKGSRGSWRSSWWRPVCRAVRYNTFVGQEEGIKAQWAQVENQLQRRNDLIPNLVETTKGIAQQEQDVFGRIAESRAKMAGAQTPEAAHGGRQRAELGAWRGCWSWSRTIPELGRTSRSAG